MLCHREATRGVRGDLDVAIAFLRLLLQLRCIAMTCGGHILTTILTLKIMYFAKKSLLSPVLALLSRLVLPGLSPET